MHTQRPRSLATSCIAGILAGSDGLGAALQGTTGGPWTSEYCWSYTETTTYTGWKITIDNACDHELNCGDNVTVEYHLQLLEAVEEAIWAEEIRIQDDASDAKWHDELLRRTTASYELRCRDYVTWFNNYKRRKATEQYRLDRVHQLRRAKVKANITQKLAAALTIFLWNC